MVPSPTVARNKWKALINLRKFENDALKVRSVKNSRSLWSAHDHCVYCCLRRRSVQLHGIIEILLGWREQDYKLPPAHQPKSPQLKHLTKHMAYVFYKNHICFFLSVLKKTNTLHLYSICGGIKTLKHNVRTTLQLAYHDCKNLTTRAKHVT